MGISRLPIPHSPLYCLLLRFVSCFFFGRVHATSRPALSVHRLVGPSHCLFVPFGSFWVNLGHIGSFWVDLGHFGSFWSSWSRTRLIGVGLVFFFLGKPQIFLGFLHGS